MQQNATSAKIPALGRDRKSWYRRCLGDRVFRRPANLLHPTGKRPLETAIFVRQSGRSIATSGRAASQLPLELNRYSLKAYYSLLFDNLTHRFSFGGDRFRPDGYGGGGMQGTLTWPLKNVSKHQLPITVMSAVASASALRSQSPPKLGDVGTGLTPVKSWLKNRAGLVVLLLATG